MAQEHSAVGAESAAIVTAPNGIYVEFLGSGLIYSINYDRMFTNNLALRFGIGYFPVKSTTDNGDGTTSTINASITTIPVTLSWFPFGASSSKLELGAGLLYADLQANAGGQTARGNFIGEAGILGYRFEPPDGGFLARLAFTPFLLNGNFQPFGGLSLGYAF